MRNFQLREKSAANPLSACPSNSTASMAADEVEEVQSNALPE